MKLIAALLIFIALNLNIFAITSSEVISETVLTEKKALAVSATMVDPNTLAVTDTDLLLQAVQTGDMQPYVSFYKGRAKHRINRFLDQVFPGDDQISFMAVNGWSKGDFKAALNDAIDTTIAQVDAPTGYQMRDLMCIDGKLNDELCNSLGIFLDSIMDALDQSVVIDQEVLSMTGIDDILSRDGFFSVLLIGAEESSLDEHAEVLVPDFPQDILVGTGTELLLQAMQTGDTQPYVRLYKEQLKSRINQFLDQVFPGDDQVNLINPEITSYLLSDRMKGAFKAAINETIDTTVVQVDAPTSYHIKDLAYTHNNIAVGLYLIIDAFFYSLTDGMNILDPSIIADQNALSMANIRYDVGSRDGLKNAFASFCE